MDNFKTEPAITDENAATSAKTENKPRNRKPLTNQQRIDNLNVLIDRKKAEIERLQADIRELEGKIREIRKQEDEKGFRDLTKYLKTQKIDPKKYLQKLMDNNG